MKKVYLKWVSIGLCILITFLAVISGNFFTKKVSLQVGQIARETIYAPFQVENEMATNRKRDLAERGVLPTYKADIKIQEKAIKEIEALFDYTVTIQTTDIATKLNKTPLDTLSSGSPIGLYKEEYETLLNMSEKTLEDMKEACIHIAVQLFEAGIQVDEVNKVLEIKSILELTEWSVGYQKIAESIITAVIKPNVILDEVATQEAKKLEREKVDPVFILQGETIIDKGTRVTEETYNLLDKVGYLDTNKNTQYKNYLGVSLLILLILFFVFKYFKRRSSIRVLQDKQIYLMISIYILAIGLIRVLLGRPFVYLPLAIVAIIIALLIDIDMALMMHIILIIFASIILKGDILFIIYFFITGILSILIVGNMQERKATMKNALIIGMLQAITYLTLKLFIGATINFSIMMESSIAFATGVISVIVVVGTLPLFESLFGFVTPLQLLELTNPNQPLLKRLLLEATGTYYHSLLVANLAETAADVIGANALMARVGGYYHDIGKLTSTNYFKENQSLDNPHDIMDPTKSAQIILSHVTHGVDLAKQHHLPIYIQDMIRQHHGTSTIQYFYTKAKDKEGEELEEELFKYKGPKPRTKEAALVMLADIVEATVRSMQDRLGIEITIEQIVRKMVKQKLEEGQLDECELYISDIDKIIYSFTKMLKGMYHERIAYPERNDI